MKRRPARDPLLLEIAAAIGAGRIAVAAARIDGEMVHGVTFEDGSIIVNPIHETVDTLCHECIHRMRPHWSERTVKARTTRIMRSLSDSEIETLYGLLMATKAK